MDNGLRQSVYDLLEHFPTAKLDAMKQLFWSELNYDHANEPLSTRTWPDTARDAVIEPPTLFATAGENDGFHIIYNRLPTDRLLIGPQRPVISHMIQQHPYSLFVFSNKPQTDWHFVNVRYEKKSPSSSQGEGLGEGVTRRVFRRITVGPRERLRTATERISMLDIAEMEEAQPGLFGLSPLAIQQKHDDAFDVEKVTKDFFRTYHTIFDKAEGNIKGLSGDARRLFTQRLFNRLLFIIFLERKGWLRYQGEQDYLQALWKAHIKEVRADETDNSFYQNRLKLLFFAGLNNRNEVDVTTGVKPVIGSVPYLNGGLFEPDSLDTNPAIDVPDSVLAPALADLLYHYNYTVTESTPLDIEIAVDPEMLGKIFEELVTGRHESGSYYTPKPIVAFMGQEALQGYLQSHCPAENEAALAAFVQQRDATGLHDPERVLEALKTVKICDPACGSGAYLLGMLHELLELRTALFAARRLDDLTLYQRKLEIIQNNLYGVDIDPFAVNIARLRLWLSLVVDYHGDRPEPLPNLDFKIEVGDSLAAPDPSGQQLDMFRQQQINDFFQLKSDYLMSHGERKRLLREQIEQLRAEIKAYTRGDARLPENAFDWAVEFAEVFSGAAGGFDIVLANPPYVRQELIKEIKPMLKNRYPDVYRGTADLYVYFYARALQLLKPAGMLAFIAPNKFMRAGYGQKLRYLLSKKVAQHAIIDFGDLPVFDATIYPAILVMQKKSPTKQNEFQALVITDTEIAERLPEVMHRFAWPQPQSSLEENSWVLEHPEFLRLVKKIYTAGKPLGKKVKGNFYYGIKTGFNEAFVIDEITKNKLVSEDPNCIQVIKPWLRGREINRWSIDWNRLYLIYVPWTFPLNKYPVLRQHFNQFKEQLSSRPEAKQGRFPWYALSRYAAEYVSEFEKPKVIWRAVAQEARGFGYDVSGALSADTTYFLPTSELYLLAVLNSSVSGLMLERLCDRVQASYLRVKSIYMEQIPIPEVSPNQRGAIEALVQKCLDARGQGPQVAQWEAEINRIVYELYHLTPAEIRLVEGT